MYNEKSNPTVIIEQALHIIRGKNKYQRLVVGVDPGKDFGMAVVGDGVVLQTERTSSGEEAAIWIFNVIKHYESKLKTVKIGNGADIYRDEMIGTLDKILPSKIKLESVEESGTTKSIDVSSRSSKDTSSAIKIAMRRGHKITRKIE